MGGTPGRIDILVKDGVIRQVGTIEAAVKSMAFVKNGGLIVNAKAGKLETESEVYLSHPGQGIKKLDFHAGWAESVTVDFVGKIYFGSGMGLNHPLVGNVQQVEGLTLHELNWPRIMCLSPDQTQIYGWNNGHLMAGYPTPDLNLANLQTFHLVQDFEDYAFPRGAALGRMCVDTNGWLYVATSLGIQVLDQAGRVNFIIPTPKQPYDLCFGGKDLSELFIACGDTIYKRATKAKGVVSGQQAPIKPPAPKL